MARVSCRVLPEPPLTWVGAARQAADCWVCRGTSEGLILFRDRTAAASAEIFVDLFVQEHQQQTLPYRHRLPALGTVNRDCF